MKTSISFLKSKYDTKETIDLLNKSNADYIHVDIMDGEFVPRVQLPIQETLDLFEDKNHLPLDIHLMVSYPLEYIEKLKVLKPEIITIHSEIETRVETYLRLIKYYNIKAGLAINPNTSVKDIESYLKYADYVLIMGVTPGYGGQPLIVSTIDKIRELIEFRKKNHLSYVISFDGGVNKDTLSLLKGLDIIVSGSYVCMSDDYNETINTLKHI